MWKKGQARLAAGHRGGLAKGQRSRADTCGGGYSPAATPASGGQAFARQAEEAGGGRDYGMSLHIMFMRVKNNLPGGLTPEVAVNYKNKGKIDWLINYDNRLYINIEKMMCWARIKGRAISDELKAGIEEWGFEFWTEGQG